MKRGLGAVVLVALATAAPATAAVRVVEPFPPARYAESGAIGLAVPGAGPTVTRQSALNTLLTGKVESSLLGGAPAGTPLIELGVGPPPDTLVVLPPVGKSENDRYPIAVTPGARGVLTSSSTRIDGLVSLADVAHGRLEVVAVDDPVATLERLESRIERNDRIRLPLTILLGAIAYIAAVLAPGLAPRVVLVGLAANLWLAGWWVVALVALAAVLLPLGLACAAVLAAYLVVLGGTPRRSRSHRSARRRRVGSTVSRTSSRRCSSFLPCSAPASSGASGWRSPASRSSRSQAAGSERTAAGCSSSWPRTPRCSSERSGFGST